MRVRGIIQYRPQWFPEGEPNGYLTQSWDKNLWNIAVDYSINSLQSKMGFKIPSLSRYAPKFEGKSADEIYRYLLSRNSITWYRR